MYNHTLLTVLINPSSEWFQTFYIKIKRSSNCRVFCSAERPNVRYGTPWTVWKTGESWRPHCCTRKTGMLYGGGENKFRGTLGQQDVDISFSLLRSYFQMLRMHTLWEQILRRQTSLTQNLFLNWEYLQLFEELIVNRNCFHVLEGNVINKNLMVVCLFYHKGKPELSGSFLLEWDWKEVRQQTQSAYVSFVSGTLTWAMIVGGKWALANNAPLLLPMSESSSKCKLPSYRFTNVSTFFLLFSWLIMWENGRKTKLIYR